MPRYTIQLSCFVSCLHFHSTIPGATSANGTPGLGALGWVWFMTRVLDTRQPCLDLFPLLFAYPSPQLMRSSPWNGPCTLMRKDSSANERWLHLPLSWGRPPPHLVKTRHQNTIPLPSLCRSRHVASRGRRAGGECVLSLLARLGGRLHQGPDAACTTFCQHVCCPDKTLPQKIRPMAGTGAQVVLRAEALSCASHCYPSRRLVGLQSVKWPSTF